MKSLKYGHSNSWPQSHFPALVPRKPWPHAPSTRCASRFPTPRLLPHQRPLPQPLRLFNLETTPPIERQLSNIQFLIDSQNPTGYTLGSQRTIWRTPRPLRRCPRNVHTRTMTLSLPSQLQLNKFTQKPLRPFQFFRSKPRHPLRAVLRIRMPQTTAMLRPQPPPNQPRDGSLPHKRRRLNV